MKYLPVFDLGSATQQFENCSKLSVADRNFPLQIAIFEPALQQQFYGTAAAHRQ
jgi:hypothetical protein